MKRQIQWLTVVAALFALLTVGAPMAGENMEDMIKNAKTKGEHEVLASHYEMEGKGLQQKATEHKKMGQVYGAFPHHYKGAETYMQHCNAIASNYEKAAGETLELAKLHRQMASEAKE
jgi:hypothetical protein